MTSRRVGDYDALVILLRDLISEWRTRGTDATANVPAAREAWMTAAREIADLLGPEAQGAPVPVHPSPPALLDSAEAKLNRRDWVGAALDLIRVIRSTDPAVDYGPMRRRWDAVADRLLMLTEALQATDEAAEREAAADR